MNRIEQARAEISRRRTIAAEASPGPWWDSGRDVGRAGGRTVAITPYTDDTCFIAANDPMHVLRVLAAASATLDRHHHVPVHVRGCEEDHGGCDPYVTAPACAVCGWDGRGTYSDEVPPWPCPDAAAVLDLYAPEPV